MNNNRNIIVILLVIGGLALITTSNVSATLGGTEETMIDCSNGVIQSDLSCKLNPPAKEENGMNVLFGWVCVITVVLAIVILIIKILKRNFEQ